MTLACHPNDALRGQRDVGDKYVRFNLSAERGIMGSIGVQSNKRYLAPVHIEFLAGYQDLPVGLHRDCTYGGPSPKFWREREINERRQVFVSILNSDGKVCNGTSQSTIANLY